MYIKRSVVKIRNLQQLIKLLNKYAKNLLKLSSKYLHDVEVILKNLKQDQLCLELY